MRKCFWAVGMIAAVMAVDSSAADAVLLTFEDVPGSIGATGDMPTYKGFNFSSTLDWLIPGAVYGGAIFGHSGNFSILNNLGGIGVVTEAGGADFTFDGLWAAKTGFGIFVTVHIPPA